MELNDDLLLETPPPIEGLNPMPTDWADKVPRHRGLWETAEAQHYDPNTSIKWDDLRADDFSEKERVALAYWWSVNGTFENSGVPTFGVRHGELVRASLGRLDVSHAADDRA